MHFYELSMNINVENQCIDRMRRIENSWNVVYVFKYFVTKTIISRSVVRNIEKCLFETSTNLNREIVDDDEDVEHVEIDEWIEHDDRLYRTNSMKMIHLNLQSLTSTQFVRFVLTFQIEKTIDIAWNESEKKIHKMIILTWTAISISFFYLVNTVFLINNFFRLSIKINMLSKCVSMRNENVIKFVINCKMMLNDVFFSSFSNVFFC